MEPAEALSIACQLVSESHVAGLMQRLLLNTFQWSHAASSPSEPALRFGGVFVLTSCANHDCQPNVELKTSWSALPEEEEVVVEEEEVENDDHRASNRARESCSMVLRTLRPIAMGDELRLSYVDSSMNLDERRSRLEHWGFRCTCDRCKREEQVQEGGAQESETGSSSRDHEQGEQKKRRRA